MLNALEFRERMEQADALVARGHTIEIAASQIGVTVASYSLWLAEHGNQVPVAVDRLSRLQTENARLRRALAKMSVELNALKHTGPARDAFARAA